MSNRIGAIQCFPINGRTAWNPTKTVDCVCFCKSKIEKMRPLHCGAGRIKLTSFCMRTSSVLLF